MLISPSLPKILFLLVCPQTNTNEPNPDGENTRNPSGFPNYSQNLGCWGDFSASCSQGSFPTWDPFAGSFLKEFNGAGMRGEELEILGKKIIIWTAKSSWNILTIPGFPDFLHHSQGKYSLPAPRGWCCASSQHPESHPREFLPLSQPIQPPKICPPHLSSLHFSPGIALPSFPHGERRRKKKRNHGEHHWRAHKPFEGADPIFATPRS